MHIKDLSVDFDGSEIRVNVGKGKIPVPQIFETLKKMHYPGTVDLEYEIHAKDPQEGMAESFAYMRGVLDGQAS